MVDCDQAGRPAAAAARPIAVSRSRRGDNDDSDDRDQTTPGRGQPESTGQRPADVFVVFGITGDLAKVMTFRSLYRLERRGLLHCPIVGVAVDDWTVDQLVRARPRVDRGHRGVDRHGRLRPVRGAAVLRAGRLRRRRDLPAGRRGDQGRRQSRCSTWRSRRSCSARWSRAWPRPA